MSGSWWWVRFYCLEFAAWLLLFCSCWKWVSMNSSGNVWETYFMLSKKECSVEYTSSTGSTGSRIIWESDHREGTVIKYQQILSMNMFFFWKWGACRLTNIMKAVPFVFWVWDIQHQVQRFKNKQKRRFDGYKHSGYLKVGQTVHVMW